MVNLIYPNDSSNYQVSITIKRNENATTGTVINDLRSGVISNVPVVNGISGSEASKDISILFNYPNATNVVMGTQEYKGHVLAPNADIEVGNTQINGCLVGNSIYSSAEGHMWPYTAGTILSTDGGFTARKTVNKLTPTNNEIFRFILEEFNSETGSWDVLHKAENNGEEVAFMKINYTQAGTYWYRIREDNTSVKTPYTADTTQYVVKTVVTANQADESVELQTESTFYKVESESTLIQEGNINTNALNQINGQDEVTFDNNRINDDKGSLKITKSVTLNGEPTTTTKVDGTYEFTITKDGKTIRDNVQIIISNGESNSVTIDSLEPGEYVITEKNHEGTTLIKPAGGSVTVRVTANNTDGIPTASFTNNKDTGEEIQHSSITINKKDQDNKALEGATFKLYHGETEVATYSGTSFTIKTDDPNLANYLPTENDQTVILYLKETAAPKDYELDSTAHPVMITASITAAYDDTQKKEITTTAYTITIDDKTSTDIINRYTQPESVSIQFSGVKTLNGKQLQDKEFSFTLTGSDDTNQTVNNDGEGKITFDEITYSEAGIYTYKVKEEASDEKGITIDSTIYNITVTVTDDGSGQLKAVVEGADPEQLDFVNTYKAGTVSITLGGTKTFEGYPEGAEAPQFTYTLSEGDTLIDQQTTKGAGEYRFNSITYEKAGEHTYTVKETKGDAARVTYDEKEYTFTVKVTDDGSGQLKAVVEGADPEKLDFTNTYQAAPTFVEFSGTKTLSGKQLQDKEFSFTLTGSDDTKQTVCNDGEGKITFAPITYTKDGTYTYEVKEEASDEKGITIDSTVYKITVTVTDDGSGQLKAAVEGADPEKLDFSNKYDPSDSDKPSDSSEKKHHDAPDTGDNNSIALYAALIAVSFTGIIGLVLNELRIRHR